jgi:nucleoside-diphosphate-sugar epimerase
MTVVLTGSSGRVVRAIFGALAGEHEVVGIDRQVFATTRLVGDVGNRALLEHAIGGADAVIHSAALHSPHVGVVADAEFQRINEDCTRLLIKVAAASGFLGSFSPAQLRFTVKQSRKLVHMDRRGNEP